MIVEKSARDPAAQGALSSHERAVKRRKEDNDPSRIAFVFESTEYDVYHLSTEHRIAKALPAFIEGNDEMLDSSHSIFWQDLGSLIDAPDDAMMGFPMVADPFPPETSGTHCPISVNGPFSTANGWPHDDRPLNSNNWGHNTLSLDRSNFLQGLARSPSLESPGLTWLTDNSKFTERRNVAAGRLDDRAKSSSQTKTQSASTTDESDALMMDGHGTAFPETIPLTSLSSFSSLGLSPDILSNSASSQPASIDSSPSDGWGDGSSVSDVPIRYFGEQQSWGLSQQASPLPAWYNDLLDDEQQGDDSAGGMHPVSDVVTAYSKDLRRHERSDDADNGATTTSTGAPNISFDASFTEGTSKPYGYSSSQAIECSDYNELASLDFRLENDVESRSKVQSSLCMPLYLSSNSVRPSSQSDNGKGLLLNHLNCTTDSYVQARSRFACSPRSSGDNCERVIRQHRGRHALVETHVKTTARSTSITPNATLSKSQRRRSKDAFLVKSRVAGMSYKEIKSKGNFSEAESTLRGRFRALTKNRKQRVRKPEWTDRDIELLLAAVEALAEDSSNSRVQTAAASRAKESSKPPKIPWKRVADCIASRGGSYHFGNATCRKKWDEIQSKG